MWKVAPMALHMECNANGYDAVGKHSRNANHYIIQPKDFEEKICVCIYPAGLALQSCCRASPDQKTTVPSIVVYGMLRGSGSTLVAHEQPIQGIDTIMYNPSLVYSQDSPTSMPCLQRILPLSCTQSIARKCKEPACLRQKRHAPLS